MPWGGSLGFHSPSLPAFKDLSTWWFWLGPPFSPGSLGDGREEGSLGLEGGVEGQQLGVAG